MKSFLAKEGKPTLLWSKVPDGYYFEGQVPEGYTLCVCPSDNYVILDIDNKPGRVNGLKNIPNELYDDLFKYHFNYPSKSGYHVWLKYTGDKILKNKTTPLGLDLRTADGKKAKGYVRWYPKEDVRNCIDLINPTSLEINKFLEDLFV